LKNKASGIIPQGSISLESLCGKCFDTITVTSASPAYLRYFLGASPWRQKLRSTSQCPGFSPTCVASFGYEMRWDYNRDHDDTLSGDCDGARCDHNSHYLGSPNFSYRLRALRLVPSRWWARRSSYRPTLPQGRGRLRSKKRSWNGECRNGTL